MWYTKSDLYENEDGNLELIAESTKYVMEKIPGTGSGVIISSYADPLDEEPTTVVTRSTVASAITYINEEIERKAYDF